MPGRGRRGGGSPRLSRQTSLLVFIALLVLLAAILLLSRSRTGPAAPSPTAPPPSVGATTATAPSAGGAFQVYFTTPRVPDDPAAHHGGPDEPLVALMDRATRSLDVADYDFDLANVASAMARAKGRGVTVRMVTDTDTLTNTKNKFVQQAFDTLKKADVPSRGRQAKPDHAQQVHRGRRRMGVDRFDELHRRGRLPIEQQPGDRSIAPARPELFRRVREDVREAAVWTIQAARGPLPRLDLGGHGAENYFAPEDKVAGKIVEKIDGASRSIHFLAFSFTHDGIGQAMMKRASAGVSVQGVFETTGANTQFSEYPKMKKAGLDVYLDGNPNAMHEKVILVDEHLVIFGSFNFSASADEDNDENLLVVDDPGLASQFEAEFQRVLAWAKNAKNQ